MTHVENIINYRRESRFLWIFSVITLLGYQFYGAAFLNSFFIKLSCTLLVIAILLYVRKYLIRSVKSIPFYNLCRNLTFVIFFSEVMAWIFKEQSIFLTFTVASRGALQILLFFYIWKVRPTKSILEKYILLFGVLYIILWLYAMYKIPEAIFGNMGSEDGFDESRGLYRINFVGRGNLIFAFFLCLNKYKDTRIRKWLLFAAIFFIFNVLQVTRQLILWPLLVGVVYMLWNKRKWCYFAVIIVLLLYLFKPTIKFSDDSMLGSMLNLTEQQVESQQSGVEDVRVRAYNFFFTEWHTNPITFFFGTGEPHGASKFGIWYERNVFMKKRYFLTDVGYASMFATYGLIGLLLWVILYIKGSLFKVSSSLTYTRLWFFFLILANIAAGWYSKSDFIIPTIISLYLMGQDRMNLYENNKSISL